MSDDRGAQLPDAQLPDAHLRAALRHAPDADVGPPAALDRAILRAAREAVQAAAPVRTRRWTVLPWSSALAGLSVATLFGLTWLPEAMWLPTVTDEVPVDVAQPAPTPPAEAAPPPVLADAAAVSRAPVESRRRADKPAAAVAPARESPPEPMSPAPSPRPQAAEAREASVAAAPAPPALSAQTASRAELTADSAERRAATGLQRRAAPEPAALRRLAALDASAAASWRWQSDVGERPHDAAMSRWVAAVLAEAHGRWHPHAGDPPAGATWRALENGEPRGVLTLLDDAVYWRDEAGHAAWRAPLDAAQRERIGPPPRR